MKIAIIEPYLTDYSGHYYNFVSDLKKGFVDKGNEVHVIGNVDSIVQEVDFKLVPTPMEYTFKNKPFIKIKNHVKYIFSLIKFFNKIFKDDYELFVITSLNYWGLLLAVALLDLRKPVFLYVHNIDIIFVGKSRYLRWLFKLLIGSKTKLVKIFTPCSASSGEYKEKLLNIENFCVTESPYVQKAPEYRPDVIKTDRFVVAYLGDVRIEKGIFDVCDFIERYHSEFDFLLQIAEPFNGFEYGVKERFSALESLDREDVSFIKENLDYNEYLEKINESSVILLLYDKINYRNRFSGMLLEAFYLGKPIITTSDTWLASQVSKYGGGEVIEDTSPETIKKILLKIKDNYARYSREALSAGEKLYRENNGHALAELMIENYRVCGRSK